MTRPAKFHLPKKKCSQKLTKRRAAKGSFRWKKIGKTFLLIACPVGKWNKKAKHCKVGTFAVEKVKARKGDACPTGSRRT